MNDKILSIQSKVSYGFVGNNVAELAIQAHGLDIISLPTVFLATHTGHQPIFGSIIDIKLFDELVKGIKNLDIIKDVIHIMSGYIGSEEILNSTAKLVEEIKSKHPDKLYICDPVMGDVGRGLYIKESLASAIMDKLIPLCDIMTPNFFEFEYITGKEIKRRADALEAAKSHPLTKGKTVIITSCLFEDTPDQKLEIMIIKENEYHSVMVDKIPIETTGTGDLFASITVALFSLGKSIEEAVEHAAKVVKKALKHVIDNNLPELNAKSIMSYMFE